MVHAYDLLSPARIVFYCYLLFVSKCATQGLLTWLRSLRRTKGEVRGIASNSSECRLLPSLLQTVRALSTVQLIT